MENSHVFISLENVLGNSKATNTTVALYNTCLYVKKDKKGKYVERAIKPFDNGVIIEKQYI